jgi:hypothetical protein
MTIAVADEGGNIVAPVRMDNAWIGGIDISMKKAYTSRAFEIETRELAKHCQSRGEFFGVHVSTSGKITIFAGGIPLKLGGKAYDPTRQASFPDNGRTLHRRWIRRVHARSHKWKGQGTWWGPTTIYYSSFLMWDHLTRDV